MGKGTAGGLIKRFGDTSGLCSVLLKRGRKTQLFPREGLDLHTLPQNHRAKWGSTDAANDRHSVNLFGGN